MKAWGSVIESPLGTIPSPACGRPTARPPAGFNKGDRPAPVELSEPGNQAASSQPSADDRQIGIKHQPRLHPIFLGGNPGEQPTEQRQQQRHAEEHEVSHPSPVVRSIAPFLTARDRNRLPSHGTTSIDVKHWNGSPEIRTQDQPVKSRMLYR